MTSSLRTKRFLIVPSYFIVSTLRYSSSQATGYMKILHIIHFVANICSIWIRKKERNVGDGRGPFLTKTQLDQSLISWPERLNRTTDLTKHIRGSNYVQVQREIAYKNIILYRCILTNNYFSWLLSTQLATIDSTQIFPNCRTVVYRGLTSFQTLVLLFYFKDT